MANKAHKFKAGDQVVVDEKIHGKVVAATFINSSLEIIGVEIDTDNPDVAGYEFEYPVIVVPSQFVKPLEEEGSNIIEVDFRS